MTSPSLPRLLLAGLAELPRDLPGSTLDALGLAACLLAGLLAEVPGAVASLARLAWGAAREVPAALLDLVYPADDDDADEQAIPGRPASRPGPPARPGPVRGGAA